MKLMTEGEDDLRVQRRPRATREENSPEARDDADGIVAAYPNTHRNLNRLSTVGVFNRDRMAAGFDP